MCYLSERMDGWVNSVRTLSPRGAEDLWDVELIYENLERVLKDV